jgi:hypothetical protein
MAVLRYHEIMSSRWSLLLVLAVLPVAALLFLTTCIRTIGWMLKPRFATPCIGHNVGNAGECHGPELITPGTRE